MEKERRNPRSRANLKREEEVSASSGFPGRKKAEYVSLVYRDSGLTIPC
jgi:hypothetical protein